MPAQDERYLGRFGHLNSLSVGHSGWYRFGLHSQTPKETPKFGRRRPPVALYSSRGVIGNRRNPLCEKLRFKLELMATCRNNSAHLWLHLSLETTGSMHRKFFTRHLRTKPSLSISIAATITAFRVAVH